MEKTIAASSAPTNAARQLPAHIPALDGIRGLAFMCVLVFHTTHLAANNRLDSAIFTATRAGWCGVDLFFVLSGFLITGILIDAKTDPHYFRNFYARRILRIFPLYYVVVFFSVMIPLLHAHTGSHTGTIVEGGLFRPVPHGGLAYWLYLSNLFPIHHPILTVTWSLAIEEQFYMLWPLVIYFSSARSLKWIAGGAFALASITRCFMLSRGVDHEIIRQFTLSKFDALSCGAMLAMYVRRATLVELARTARRVLLLTAVVLAAFIVWQRGLWDSSTAMLLAGLPLLAIFFTALIGVAITSGDGWMHALFSSRFLRAVGGFSYAMYLFHVSIDSPLKRLLARYGAHHDGLPLLLGSALIPQVCYWALITGITMGAAWISWNILEKRCLKLKARFAPRPQRVPDRVDSPNDLNPVNSQDRDESFSTAHTPAAPPHGIITPN